MKKPSKNIFNLIKSLTISEKGYFIKFAKRHVIGEENNYLKLFDAINKQDVYDEEKLKEQFKGEKFVKQLTTAKNYLLNMILKSLENYHREDSVDSKIAALMSHYKILFEKTLFDQAEELLKRAKTLARDSERFTKLIDILKDERSFDYNKIGDPGFEDYSVESLKEETEILDKLKNIAEYNNLYLRFSSRFKKIGIARNKSDAEKFNQIVEHKLLKSEDEALSVRAKNFYFITKYLYYYCTGNTKKAFEYGEKRLELIDSNSDKISGADKEYIYALGDATAFAYNLNKFNLCLKYLKMQREIAQRFDNKRDTPNHLGMHLKSYSFELNIYSESGYFAEGVETTAEVIKWLDKYQGKISKSEELKVIYDIAYLYFGAGDYTKSLFWVNKILNDNSNLRQDYKIFAKIMNLIIHYELGNIDLLEYNIKSVLRYLSKNEKLYKYEYALLKFIKKIPILDDHKDLSFEFHQLKTELDKISKDNYEKKASQYFDIVSWLESKIYNKKFSDIIREKSKVTIDIEQIKAA